MKRSHSLVAASIIVTSLLGAGGVHALSQPNVTVTSDKAAAGVNVPEGMKPIVSLQADVTGDQKTENITLLGKKIQDSTVYYEELQVVVEDQTTHQKEALLVGEGGYEPKLSLIDFTGDKKEDLLVSADTGGSGGFSTSHLYTMNNGKLKELSLPGISLDQKVGLVEAFTSVRPIDLNQDGVYELQGMERIVGKANADTRVYLSSIWKWNKQQWELTQVSSILPETFAIYGQWEDQKKGTKMELTPDGQLLRAGVAVGTYHFLSSNSVFLVSENKASTLEFVVDGDQLMWGTNLDQVQNFRKVPTEAEKETNLYENKVANFHFEIPARWTGNYTIHEYTDAEIKENYSSAKHVVDFAYQTQKEDDTQSLFTIMVFGKQEWKKIAAEEGPPIGEVLMEDASQVFVVAMPQSNPFEMTSADGKLFDSMVLSFTEVKKAFSLANR